MFRILANRTYRALFIAQVVALLGSGLATVALGLMAWQIGGENAGVVLGTALAIKMVAYVTLAPVASALSERWPRRRMLIMLDLIRAGVAVALPFVSAEWQIYVLIFLLQAASAGFTPTFQATIPDILPNEQDYTKALSLSRLAYDLESLISPMLAAALLLVVSFPVLFGGTVVGFLLSALMVASVTLPKRDKPARRDIWDRTTKGMRIYLATPRLRGILALNMVVSAVGAVVIVNTVVIVQAMLGMGDRAVALALAAFGGGSMVSAFALPPLLNRLPDRTVMVSGAALLTVGCFLGAFVGSFAMLVLLWAVLGFGFGTTQTPTGRVLRHSARRTDLPALFAAQFSLSHLCWLFAYPLAGRFGAGLGLQTTFFVMSGIAVVALFAAVRLWPDHEPATMPHDHPDLPPDHPHLRNHGTQHSHPYLIDDLHPRWP